MRSTRELSLTQSNDNPLPAVATELSTEEIKARLLKLSKRGKLAGYEGEDCEGIAQVAAHGTPFDSKLIINHNDGQLEFELRLISLMPRIFALLLVITVWPGLPLTDDFLSSFQWYEKLVASTGVKTWYWYLPMTILPAPFALRSAIKKSKSSAFESAIETIEKLGKVLGIDSDER